MERAIDATDTYLDKIVVGNTMRSVIGTCMYHNMSRLWTFTRKVPRGSVIMVRRPKVPCIFGLDFISTTTDLGQTKRRTWKNWYDSPCAFP